MRKTVLGLLAKQVITTSLGNKAVWALACIISLLMVYAAVTGLQVYNRQTSSTLGFKKQVRDNWEKMPDKHPHRMAHYGYIVFRARHPLSFFDAGMESYTGNAVFLEAHRQNTVNFSEAESSTGLLRFGEISLAMILQMLVPLTLFFIGFGTVAADRENGTLKLLLSQGVSWKEIITGKAIGLICVALCLLLPAVLLLLGGWMWIPGKLAGEVLRLPWIILLYVVYLCIISTIAVLVSTAVKTARSALVVLLGLWLLFTVILPRTAQAIGTYLYPSPSKIAFDTAIEKDLIKQGDSHNPNDAHYKALKDSVLRVYKADSVQQLSFNYSGFQMKEGERLSAAIYNRHLANLLKIYQQQNNVSRISAFINPFAAIRTISMAVCGTDFNSYVRFQQQAEDYRYRLAQHMNDLQIKLISNKKLSDKAQPYRISKSYWKAFPDFTYQQASQADIISNEAISLMALVCWTVLLTGVTHLLSKKIKAV